VREPEYDSGLQVRRVQNRGEFYGKHQSVFLSEVLCGERIGLLPAEERGYTIFFARFPIARFDSRRLKILPLLDPHDSYGDGAGEGMECTPKVRQQVKGPATLNGGERCWCPDNSILVN
jgi:hypothetical protein